MRTMALAAPHLGQPLGPRLQGYCLGLVFVFLLASDNALFVCLRHREIINASGLMFGSGLLRLCDNQASLIQKINKSYAKTCKQRLQNTMIRVMQVLAISNPKLLQPKP